MDENPNHLSNEALEQDATGRLSATPPTPHPFRQGTGRAKEQVAADNHLDNDKNGDEQSHEPTSNEQVQDGSLPDPEALDHWGNMNSDDDERSA